MYAAGQLLYVREGTLLAQPFDAESARLSGEARPLVNDLFYFRSSGVAAFTVSDNGILAWRSAQRQTRMAWLDRNGIETKSIATARFEGEGRLSRDGKRFAAGVLDPKQGLSDVWVYDLEREIADRLTLDLVDEKAPVWAHDGQSIYYRADGNRSPPDIFMLRPGERPAVLHSGPSLEHPEDVSPDGKSLLFTSFSGESDDIHLLPLDPPGAPRVLLVTPVNERSPRFSPDGRWISYASNQSGRFEVYVMPVRGGSAVRVSQNGGTLPRWSGRELFFLGAEGRVFAVEVGDTAGTPRMLFQAADAMNFEVAPAGDRFLVQLRERSGQPDIQLLVNWTELLRE
jgi:eukaryotic-like serine/threonine-protein kinase